MEENQEENLSPKERIQRIQRFVYDLAWQVVSKEWQPIIRIKTEVHDKWWLGFIGEYVQVSYRDKNEYVPSLQLLISLDYVAQIDNVKFRLTDKAFALLEKAPPISIFISYRHSVSSALAMLIWSELQREGFSPFLDISDIKLGDEIFSLIEDKVKKSDVFISIIGPDTLGSDSVKAEINWALKKRADIIMVLHSGFTIENLKTHFPKLAKKNAVVVPEDTSIYFYSCMEQIKRTLWLMVDEQS